MSDSLHALAAALCTRSDWAASDGPIEIRQTHVSLVLLGRRCVLKLKKPVDFGFLDFTTLEKRRLACQAEVRLNRRLCPETYLGVRAVVEQNGVLQLAAESTPGALEYGVWMARLPEDRLLDRMVSTGAVTESVIDRIARRLGDFFASARTGPDLDCHATRQAIRANWQENFAQIAPHVGHTISAQSLDHIRAWVTRWLETNEPLLDERIRARKIVEGHGDIRCESICATEPISIFDCIEFNERFRANDPANEIAFLAADLDAHGRPDLGYYFTERYAAHSGDEGIWPLLPFYRSYRAFVRGKVHSFVSSDAGIPLAARDRATAMAARWLDLSLRYASPLTQPAVIAVCGFSGTGKTSLARSIAGELGLRAVSSDLVRREIFGPDKQPAPYARGIYGPDARQAVYRRMSEAAAPLAARYGGVVLDATFGGPAERELAAALAADSGAALRVIECDLSPEIVRRRLADRTSRKDGDSDATWEIYERQRQSGWTPWDAGGISIDTSGPLSAAAARATNWLRMSDRAVATQLHSC